MVHVGQYWMVWLSLGLLHGCMMQVRVVPEFDIPGHSRGFIPLEPDGIEFCTADATRSQLYGSNATYKVRAH